MGNANQGNQDYGSDIKTKQTSHRNEMNPKRLRKGGKRMSRLPRKHKAFSKASKKFLITL